MFIIYKTFYVNILNHFGIILQDLSVVLPQGMSKTHDISNEFLIIKRAAGKTCFKQILLKRKIEPQPTPQNN